MNLARAAYHEQSLGHGLDDYYSEWGERPGLWWGGGADLLGLEGYAAPGSIVSLIEGRDPASGELLRRPTSSAFVTRRVFDPASGGVVERQVEQKRVGGWDFAFSAPKSVSLALTFGDTDTRRELLASHRAAVEAALLMLESEAVRVRVAAQGVAVRDRSSAPTDARGRHPLGLPPPEPCQARRPQPAAKTCRGRAVHARGDRSTRARVRPAVRPARRVRGRDRHAPLRVVSARATRRDARRGRRDRRPDIQPRRAQGLRQDIPIAPPRAALGASRRSARRDRAAPRLTAPIPRAARSAHRPSQLPSARVDAGARSRRHPQETHLRPAAYRDLALARGRPWIVRGRSVHGHERPHGRPHVRSPGVRLRARRRLDEWARVCRKAERLATSNSPLTAQPSAFAGMGDARLELATPSLSSWCSPN
jgi:hypothetical protein